MGLGVLYPMETSGGHRGLARPDEVRRAAMAVPFLCRITARKGSLTWFHPQSSPGTTFRRASFPSSAGCGSATASSFHRWPLRRPRAGQALPRQSSGDFRRWSGWSSGSRAAPSPIASEARTYGGGRLRTAARGSLRPGALAGSRVPALSLPLVARAPVPARAKTKR